MSWAAGAINGAAGPTTRPVTPPGVTLGLTAAIPALTTGPHNRQIVPDGPIFSLSVSPPAISFITRHRSLTPASLNLGLALSQPSFSTNAALVLGTFDFAPGTTVWEEMQPPETAVVSFRGWDFTAKPSTPYRPNYKLSLRGMRWYLNAAGTALDLTTNPHTNAGRLRAFYIANRTWASFYYTHEVLGTALYKFVSPVQIPPALVNSGGLIDTFEVMIVQVNPGYQ